MAVLIKEMGMPKNCDECPLNSTCGYSLHMPLYHIEKRHDDCPLVEVPEPHGRLIDADALLMSINHEVMEAYMDGVCYGVHPSQEHLYLLGEIIDDAPTIIPAM